MYKCPLFQHRQRPSIDDDVLSGGQQRGNEKNPHDFHYVRSPDGGQQLVHVFGQIKETRPCIEFVLSLNVS